MTNTFSAFVCGAIALSYGLLNSCSPSNKDNGMPTDPPSDSVYTNITRYSKSPVDSINFEIACISYWSGRLHVTATNADKGKIVFQHDYHVMPAFVGHEGDGKVPGSTFWLNRHQFFVLDVATYRQLNLNYNMWSVVDLDKNKNVDLVIRAGGTSDTTYCSFPFPWYDNTLIASISHKGKDEAIIYDTDLKVKHKTAIAGNLKQLPFLLSNQVMPISYEEFIDYNDFPDLVTRTNLNGTVAWKSSAFLELFNLHFKDYGKPVVTKTDSEVDMTIAGLTWENKDTVVVVRFGLATGELL